MREPEKRKRKLLFAAAALLVLVAAGLGYWKRRGIRNTVMRMAGLEVPRKIESYGYYGQAIKAKTDVNDTAVISENDEAAARYESNIPVKETLVASSIQIDALLEEELANGEYAFEDPMVIMDPFQISPLTGVILFSTQEECRVRCRIAGKTKAADITYETAAQTGHRVPLVGLYPGETNKVTLELLTEEGEADAVTTLEVDAGGLPAKIDGMVEPLTVSGSSAFGLTMVYGQKCLYPFAYDCNGDIRWYLEKECANYGIYMLSNGNYILQDPGMYTPSGEKPQSVCMYEMDYLGRACRMYYLPHGSHHEVIEKEPGGNLLCLTSSMENHIEDTIIEIDRESGLSVNTLNLKDLFLNTYMGRLDWAHINTVSYHAEDDSILISARNLHSVMKIGWTDHKLKWILADPAFWEKTKYSKYVLQPDGDFLWHYQQHSSYRIEEDLDGDPETVQISIFDNHTHGYRKVKTYTDTGKSYVTVYAVNEKKGSVSVLKQHETLLSKICSNTIYDPESGHIFGMAGTISDPAYPDYQGMNYEFDYESGEVINQYLIRNKFYRASPVLLNGTVMSEPLSVPEPYLTGEIPRPAKTGKKVPETDRMLGDEVTLTRTGSVLCFRALDHHISQVIFEGGSHTYVYDTTAIKLEYERYLNYLSNMPVALTDMEPDTYEILCVYEDELYRTSVNNEAAYVTVPDSK